eukprot:TRINITY_DN70618_c0_g1_i1.p1 TRINITY_DN70618_c0_g1~~TRINITY_DN70618_c0_g1_i1.p1  ORF type:complete len:381 (-),score=45.15 TRINITY_DN70618_c0_g1_i1:25-1080(-)
MASRATDDGGEEPAHPKGLIHGESGTGELARGVSDESTASDCEDEDEDDFDLEEERAAFWREPGHFLLPEIVSMEECEWLRELNALHGKDISAKRPSTATSSTSMGTAASTSSMSAGSPATCSQESASALPEVRGVKVAAAGEAEERCSVGNGGSGFLPDDARGRILSICSRLARAVAHHDGRPHFLDLAILSRTARCGHRPHVDNERPVWLPDGTCRWVAGNSGHRTWSISVTLSEPWEYEDGELVFYNPPPSKRAARVAFKERAGAAIAFRGDRHHPHGVNPVPSGDRHVLVVFLRGSPEGAPVPRLLKRQGNGVAVFVEPPLRVASVGACFAGWVGLTRRAGESRCED